MNRQALFFLLVALIFGSLAVLLAQRWLQGQLPQVAAGPVETQGVVVARKGSGTREMFTVRKISGGVGVERIFPLHAPVVDRVELVRRGRVRRSKLYYLRDLKGKAARIEERRDEATATTRS